MNAQNFADQLRILGALEDGPATDRVLEAFQAVPREAFAGPGPWTFRSPHEGFTLPVRATPDADPKWLYHSVLIVLDQEKGINIGDPVFWARRFARTDIQAGARILQVGAGVGYYTAILSHLAGPDGHVVAYDVEEPLLERARANLAGYPNVTLHLGNAATDLQGEGAFDLVVAFAGVTHLPALWSSRLAPWGRMLVPLTGSDWWGATMLATRRETGFKAITLGQCGVYPCAGARHDALAKRIDACFKVSARLMDWDVPLVEEGGEVRLAPIA